MQVLQQLQAAFFAGNISTTDEGLPDEVPHEVNATTPPAALATFLHSAPEGDACAPFAAPSVRSIAIVGNGPLSTSHAAAANQHDVVVR